MEILAALAEMGEAVEGLEISAEKVADTISDKIEGSFKETFKDDIGGYEKYKAKLENSVSDSETNKQVEKDVDVENAVSDNETDGVRDVKDSDDNIGLSQKEKERIKEEKGWSDEVIDAISSIEEYEIYDRAGLVEKEVNGRKCLIKTDIDMEQKDERGRTNRERMEKGLSPIDKNRETIELHHIGQKSDAPLAELSTTEHRGKGNDAILHKKTKESEINRMEFKKEKEEHWKNREENVEEEDE